MTCQGRVKQLAIDTSLVSLSFDLVRNKNRSVLSVYTWSPPTLKWLNGKSFSRLLRKQRLPQIRINGEAHIYFFWNRNITEWEKTDYYEYYGRTNSWRVVRIYIKDNPKRGGSLVSPNILKDSLSVTSWKFSLAARIGIVNKIPSPTSARRYPRHSARSLNTRAFKLFHGHWS